MRHLFCLVPVAVLGTALLSACGDDVTQINQTGLEVVSSEDDLPKCTEDNNGVQVWVEDDMSARICVGGKWYAMSTSDTVYIENGDNSCKTEKLKDGSGLKIICNGDSIGVVLNGSDGKDGADGEDGKDAVLPNDTLEADSERVPVSLDSLAGFSQKGPFLKGSTVYLYELSDGRTLKQTNGNFTSYITRDDGRYKFSARDLASQYAMIVVEGNYRNEVTGEPSEAPIRLRALTDMRKRSDANINLLTTLEFDRVYHLVTRGDKEGKKLTVKQAKKQAQAEIFKAFDIDTTGFKGSAEDLDVFGSTDADAALLAISVMLQGDGNETDLSVLLTEIASDMETDGTWDNASTKARLADWASMADGNGRLGAFRKNVAGWKLSDTVPVFEKFVRNFYSGETKLGKCGSKDIPVGTLMNVKNPESKYYAKEYADTTSRVRFICADADSARWRVATELEKDTVGLGHEFENGNIAHGAVNKELVYVYEGDGWRHGTALDSTVGEGCRLSLKDTIVHAADDVWYKCIGDSAMLFVRNGQDESAWKGAWRTASTLEIDTNGLGHEYQEGDVHYGQVNNGLVYVYENGNWVVGKAKDDSVGMGCVATLEGKVIVGKSDGEYYICKLAYANGSPLPTDRNWEPAPNVVKDTTGWGKIGSWKDGDVRNGSVNKEQPYVFQDGAWRVGTILDSLLKQGCIADGDTSIRRSNNLYYVCSVENVAGVYISRTWVVAPDIYNDTKEYRDECKRFGEFGYGNILTGIVDSTKSYVCDNGQFRRATDSEVGADRACVNYIYDHIYKIRGDFMKCTSAGWSSVASGDSSGIMEDKAGKVYKTIVIGEQQWMKRNLNYEMDGSYYYNDNVSTADNRNCGQLYEWSAAMKACPTGWRLPTEEEWQSLVNLAGGKSVAGDKLRSQDWASGLDTYGISAGLCGYRDPNPGTFMGVTGRVYDNLGVTGAYWNSTEYGSENAGLLHLSAYPDVTLDYGKKTHAHSVRCIQDN